MNIEMSKEVRTIDVYIDTQRKNEIDCRLSKEAELRR